jgi:hypothetical protein
MSCSDPEKQGEFDRMDRITRIGKSPVSTPENHPGNPVHPVKIPLFGANS